MLPVISDNIYCKPFQIATFRTTVQHSTIAADAQFVAIVKVFVNILIAGHVHHDFSNPIHA